MWPNDMYALLVCDDNDETAILSLVLQRAGLSVTATEDLDRAIRRWSQRPTDMVLLALHHGSPVEQTHRVRHETDVLLAVIVNTQNENALCQVLDAGADWCAPRPYSARLVMAQLGALLRRSRGSPLMGLPSLSIGGMALDLATRTAHIEQRGARRLTHLEFRLLYTLMIHQGQTLPTESIVERVWGYSGEGSLELVRGLISRLRAKIEQDPRNPQYILTVAGVGYRLVAPPAVASAPPLSDAAQPPGQLC
jgi:DNA-binding response OmpR family regulator